MTLTSRIGPIEALWVEHSEVDSGRKVAVDRALPDTAEGFFNTMAGAARLYESPSAPRVMLVRNGRVVAETSQARIVMTWVLENPECVAARGNLPHDLIEAWTLTDKRYLTSYVEWLPEKPAAIEATADPMYASILTVLQRGDKIRTRDELRDDVRSANALAAWEAFDDHLVAQANALWAARVKASVARRRAEFRWGLLMPSG
jgi:hypothetical protein